jgi:hypothetical protein
VDDTDDDLDEATHDDIAHAVSDPRDRRRARTAGADGNQAADRRRSPDVPEEYRARQRSINEYPLSGDELEFINALNAYKQAYDKPFPTWSEVLHVLKSLGYRKDAHRGVRAPEAE